MSFYYLVEISNPHTHIVKISLSGKRVGNDFLDFFLPSWSPGSYLMREYSRHIRTFKASDSQGRRLYHEQTEKGKWRVSFTHPELSTQDESFTIEYEIYAHELTVRTSHVDDSHAFLHGPSLFLGCSSLEIIKPTIEFKFPPLWSKVTTALKDVSDGGEKFIYEARDYDTLLDSPIEIGCHETDGFMVDGKEHYLAFYGETYPHPYNLKEDMKKVVEHISHYVGETPYEKYTFITHFCPNLYGGLEHSDSTALHFDGRKFNDRTSYLQWLSLVSHEYFHTWNVKRIRPKELGPFDYNQENYTSMLWLAEGLTSFVDELFVYQAGLCTLEEYLKMLKTNFSRYYQIPGRKFHSLEQSSFNAWIKLYRPDENSNNSTISYYLKGGLVFLLLHIRLNEFGQSTKGLIKSLWNHYKSRPEQGLETQEFLELVSNLSNEQTAQWFYHLISSVEEIDFEAELKKIGLGFQWEEDSKLSFGAQFEFKSDRVFVRSVELDGAAHKNGLNAGDEILALNRQRMLKPDVENLSSLLKENQSYLLTLCRLGKIIETEMTPQKGPKVLKSILISDKEKVQKSLKE